MDVLGKGLKVDVLAAAGLDIKLAHGEGRARPALEHASSGKKLKTVTESSNWLILFCLSVADTRFLTHEELDDVQNALVAALVLGEPSAGDNKPGELVEVLGFLVP